MDWDYPPTGRHLGCRPARHPRATPPARNGACATVTSKSHRPTRPNRTRPADGAITNMHDVLSDPVRRHILYVLQTADGSVPLATLADRVTSQDGDDPGGDRPTADCGSPVRPVRRLRRDHVLPMDRFGILAYDPDAGTVSLADGVAVSIHPEDW